MMQPLYYFTFTFLCGLSSLSTVQSLKCNETQYAWPVNGPKLCCNMCRPGERMVRRPDDSCKIDCKPCTGKQYINTYNVEMSCNHCENCDKSNMEYKSHCNPTHNAVCGCKAGYRCDAQPCKQCVPIPSTTTTTPILPPSSTALTPGSTQTKAYRSTTTWAPPKQIKDTVWLLVVIGLLCAGFTFVVVAKIKPFLRWIKSEHDYFLAEKPAPVPQCSEDEEVSTPVQEVCGKCDQPIDV